jgi:hypothetical protein
LAQLRTYAASYKIVSWGKERERERKKSPKNDRPFLLCGNKADKGRKMPRSTDKWAGDDASNIRQKSLNFPVNVKKCNLLDFFFSRENIFIAVLARFPRMYSCNFKWCFFNCLLILFNFSIIDKMRKKSLKNLENCFKII